MIISLLAFWLLVAFSVTSACVLTVCIFSVIRLGRVIDNQRAELNRVRGLLELTRQHSRPTSGRLHKIKPALNLKPIRGGK